MLVNLFYACWYLFDLFKFQVCMKLSPRVLTVKQRWTAKANALITDAKSCYTRHQQKKPIK